MRGRYESVAYKAAGEVHVLDRWFLKCIWSTLLLLMAVGDWWACNQWRRSCPD